nr:MAG: VP1 protein [Drosophila Glencorse burn reovirus]
MYAAFVVNESQYKTWISKNRTVRVAHVKKCLMRNKKESEAFYFQFSYETLGFVVCENISYIAEFIRSGVIRDLSDINEVTNIVEYARNLQYSESEYIKACNELRNVLVDIMYDFRVCGPELECLLHKDMTSKCCEMVGLFSEGTYVQFDGTIHIKSYYLKNDDVSKEFEYVLRAFSDEGQQKLYCLIAGFAQQRTIVYIGAAPGEGWLEYVTNNGNKVIAFDPRDLAQLSPHETNAKKSKYKNITHVKEMFYTWEQINKYVAPNEKYDFIWDVRGDYIDDVQYESMVEKEIDLVNVLMRTIPNECIRINLKIRYKNLEKYQLIHNGRFFLLPFLRKRGKRELRYIVRNSRMNNKIENVNIRNKLESFFQQLDESDEQNSNTYGDDFDLYVNSKLMRLDVDNYMNVESVSQMDLNLFTLNLNNPESMRIYLENSKGVISFFLKDKLRHDEWSLPYCEELLKYAIVDTRLFIGKRIPNLRLLVPIDLTIYCDEILTSSNFRIMELGNRMMDKYGLIKYHKVKTEAAAELGMIFKRFPDEYSVTEKIMTPSGHAMRIMYQEALYHDFTMLEYFPKIVYSFWQGLKGKKRTLLLKKCNTNLNLKHKNVCNRNFEPHKGEIWHSMNEWMAGIRAGEIITGSDNTLSTLFAKFVEPIKQYVQEYDGIEVFKWKQIMLLPLKQNNIQIQLERYGFDMGNSIIDQLQCIISYIEGTFPNINKETRMGYNFNKGKDFLVRRTPLADFLISNYKMDKYVRYVIYHKLAVNMIGRGSYPNHDDSKFDYFELIWYNAKWFLQVQDRSMNEKWNEAVQHHYVNNDHHQQFWGERSMSDRAFKEHLCDLLAMCWIKDNPNQEIFYPLQHFEILSYVQRQDRQRAINVMEAMFDADDFFLLEDLRRQLKGKDGNLGFEHP